MQAQNPKTPGPEEDGQPKAQIENAANASSGLPLHYFIYFPCCVCSRLNSPAMIEITYITHLHAVLCSNAVKSKAMYSKIYLCLGNNGQKSN
jgi:hypothetical protein